jgi:hypothetical protein
MAALKIPCPAGARVLESEVSNIYNYKEVDLTGVTIYYNSLIPSEFTVKVTYLMDTPGVYIQPGVRIEEMYSPDRFAQMRGEEIVIR